MKYLFFLAIIPFLVIPSAYAAEVNLSVDYETSLKEGDSDNVCEDTGGTYADLGAGAGIWGGFTYASADVDDCIRGVWQFSLDGLPAGSEVSGIKLILREVQHISSDPIDVYLITSAQPNITAAAAMFDAIDNDERCLMQHVPNGDELDNSLWLEAMPACLPLLNTQLATTDWIGIGLKLNDETVEAASNGVQWYTNGAGHTDLTIIYDNGVDAVDDLSASDVRALSVDLAWTEPNISSGSVDGYKIFFTTPHSSNVATTLVNNTNTTATAYTVTGLSDETQYSFLVGVWNTIGGGNFSGNIINVTTAQDPTEGFTPGSFNLTATGTDLRDIRFEEITISDTSKRVNVTFPTTFTAFNCDLDYEFLQENQTYTELDDTAIPSGETGYDEVSFLFTDVDNEIITIHCWNNTPSGNGTYVLTQTSIPFVNQIKMFQAGDFGTSGDFGAIDLVTLLVFGVVATVGFNTRNEAVGAVFLFFLTFGMAWFGLITIPTLMGGIIAVVLLLVVIQVRKQ